MNDDERDLRRELLPLLDALIAGKITARDHAQLESLLEENTDARRLYAEYLELDLGIRQLQLSSAQPNATEELIRRTVSQSARTRRKSLLLGATLASACCLIIAIVSFAVWRAFDSSPDATEKRAAGDPHRTQAGPLDERPAIAKVMRLVDVEWSDRRSQLSLGDAVERQWLQLSSGIVYLEFSSGAALVAQGPARLRLDSETECFLQRGRIVVLGPPDFPEFTVTAPGARVVDRGTEFAMVVEESGETDVHVLNGEVDVSLGETAADAVSPHRLVESEAASLDPAERQIRTAPFDGESFESLRPDNVAGGHQLRIQFDCGVHAGIYDGVESPGHAAGDFYPHDRFWNLIIGDQAGRFVGADGTALSSDLEIDFGQSGKRGKTVDWDEPPTVRGSSGKSHGVFRTPLGEDGIRGGHQVGLRIRGLPAGTYRVYLLGRSSIVHHSWGNFLTDKAYTCSIGVGEPSRPGLQSVSPLDDANANEWVEGQTHIRSEVVIDSPEDYLTLIVKKDRSRSPVPKGGGATILGVQIIRVSSQD